MGKKVKHPWAPWCFTSHKWGGTSDKDVASQNAPVCVLVFTLTGAFKSKVFFETFGHSNSGAEILNKK